MNSAELMVSFGLDNLDDLDDFEVIKKAIVKSLNDGKGDNVISIIAELLISIEASITEMSDLDKCINGAGFMNLNEYDKYQKRLDNLKNAKFFYEIASEKYNLDGMINTCDVDTKGMDF